MEKISMGAEVFVGFLKGISLDGEIQQMVLEQKDDGIHSSFLAENVVGCRSYLGRKSFTTFGKIGNITVKDSKRLLDSLRSWKGVMNIERVENKMLFYNDKTELGYVLCDESFIENKLPEGMQLKFDSSFDISTDFFKELSAKAQLFGSDRVSIEVKSNVARGIVSETDTYTVKESVVYPDCASKYGRWLFKIAKLMGEGKVTVGLKTAYPIQITIKGENSEMKYFIAPIVEDNESVVVKAKESKQEKKEETVGDSK